MGVAAIQRKWQEDDNENSGEAVMWGTRSHNEAAKERERVEVGESTEGSPNVHHIRLIHFT